MPLLIRFCFYFLVNSQSMSCRWFVIELRPNISCTRVYYIVMSTVALRANKVEIYVPFHVFFIQYHVLYFEAGNKVPILECQTRRIVLIPSCCFLPIWIDEVLPQMATRSFLSIKLSWSDCQQAPSVHNSAFFFVIDRGRK